MFNKHQFSSIIAYSNWIANRKKRRQLRKGTQMRLIRSFVLNSRQILIIHVLLKTSISSLNFNEKSFQPLPFLNHNGWHLKASSRKTKWFFTFPSGKFLMWVLGGIIKWQSDFFTAIYCHDFLGFLKILEQRIHGKSLIKFPLNYPHSGTKHNLHTALQTYHENYIKKPFATLLVT